MTSTRPPAVARALIICAFIASTAQATGDRHVPLRYVAERSTTGAAAHEGERVTVRGVATVHPDIYSTKYRLFYMQDDAAGVAVFTRELPLPEIVEGTRLEVAGSITTYSGQIQIRPTSVRVIGTQAPPRPLPIELDELSDPYIQGRLVEVRGVVGRTADRSGRVVTLVSPDHKATEIYISADQIEKVKWPTLPREGNHVVIAGIASQFDPESPYKSGWQVRPRGKSDITVLPAAFLESDDLVALGGVAAIVFLTSFAWITVLRRRVKRATTSLTETVVLLRAQQEATIDGIVFADADGVMRDANERFLEMWNLRRDQLREMTIAQLLASVRTDVARAIDLQHIDTTIHTAGGSAKTLPDVAVGGRIIAVATAPLRFNGGKHGGAVWTFRDVTEREVLRDQLSRNERVASLGRLAASISHEFNNVLMAIQPQAELLKRTNPQAATAADRIIAAVHRGKRTTAEVLSLTRPVEAVVQDISVVSFIEGLTSEIQALAGSDIELVVDAISGDLYMRADREQLAQVIINLAHNAAYAMPGGGRLSVRATCNERDVYSFGVVGRDRQYIHIEVADTGVGIAPDLIEHVFEALFSTKKNGGSGLGLAIARQIVTAHDGFIFVESDKGTTFHLFVPACPRPATSRPASSNLPATIQGLRVLLVEDDAAVAHGLELMLNMAGASVMLVERGEQAAAAVQRFEPDAVVLDLDLPDMNGEVVHAQIAAMQPDLPVLFSSGHIGWTDLPGRLSGTRVAFLEKPYDTAALVGAIATFFGNRHTNAAA